MQVVFLTLSLLLAWASSVEANLCDPHWLETASQSDVQALLRQGADVNEVCNDNDNRPLHQALLTPGVGPGVIEALVDGGGDVLAPNPDGSSPLDYAERRFARAEQRLRRGSIQYGREEMIKAIVNLAVERGLTERRAAVPRTVGAVFRECDACPEMVVMPGGLLALGRYEVTVRQYGEYASATGDDDDDDDDDGCIVPSPDGWLPDGRVSWRNPGFSQSDRHPVVCVSAREASGYATWLSQMTGATYRLPRQAEWDRAASGSGVGCNANGADAELAPYLERTEGAAVFNAEWAYSCPRSDGSLFTAPVGSYGPNEVGLFDMAGNVWEWAEECVGRACRYGRVLGGSWRSGAGGLGSGVGALSRPDDRSDDEGFRVVRLMTHP